MGTGAIDQVGRSKTRLRWLLVIMAKEHSLPSLNLECKSFILSRFLYLCKPEKTMAGSADSSGQGERPTPCILI